MIKFKKKNSNIKNSVKNSSSNLSQNKESSSYLNNINQKSKIKQRKKKIFMKIIVLLKWKNLLNLLIMKKNN